jgi:beta-phosphoglucomutase-like phosphatase (HAD superfamily)
VDAEYFHNKLVSDVLTDLGLNEYTPEECIETFGGTTWEHIKDTVASKHSVNVRLPPVQERVEKIIPFMEGNMKPIHAALDFVKFVYKHAKIAVGSNGEDEIILKSLELQGFMDYFDPQNIFSKNHVPNPKPAPDLFLYAAEKMGTEPSRCLVIEDSYAGAKAGVAAGMDVFGFTGVAHDKEYATHRLTEAGATQVFDSYGEMYHHVKSAYKLTA